MNDAYIAALSNALKDQNVPAFAEGAMQILAQKIEAAKAEIAPDTYASMGFEFAPVVEEEFDEEIVEEKCEDCDDKDCEDKDEEESDKEEDESDEKDDEEEESEEEEDDDEE